MMSAWFDAREVYDVWFDAREVYDVWFDAREVYDVWFDVRELIMSGLMQEKCMMSAVIFNRA
jgi:hypothetical protein